MKCFNHPENDAVGICKNCNKGLCKECLTEVEKGIACTSSCIDDVIILNSLINHSKKNIKSVSNSQYRNTYLFGAFGFITLIYGLNTNGIGDYLSIIGVVFLLAAVFSLMNANKYKKDKDSK